jgi:hypothetical protein
LIHSAPLSINPEYPMPRASARGVEWVDFHIGLVVYFCLMNGIRLRPDAIRTSVGWHFVYNFDRQNYTKWHILNRSDQLN